MRKLLYTDGGKKEERANSHGRIIINSVQKILILYTILAIALEAPTASGEGDRWSEYSSKLSGVIISGFASTQLRAWAMLDCPLSPLDFHPLDSVWLDNRNSIPERSRPDIGLFAITGLDPGYITGPLSSVWREWVQWCVEFGVEANAIWAVPYDWRLPASRLEERDLYFHKLKFVYRLHQLNRSAQLVSSLMLSIRGAETTPQTLAINGALQTMLNFLQILGIISLWSMATFIFRLFPSQPEAMNH